MTNYDWSALRYDCVNRVARELARPHAIAARNWQELTALARPKAEAKIAAMNGVELLELIQDVVASGG